MQSFFVGWAHGRNNRRIQNKQVIQKRKAGEHKKKQDQRCFFLSSRTHGAALALDTHTRRLAPHRREPREASQQGFRLQRGRGGQAQAGQGRWRQRGGRGHGRRHRLCFCHGSRTRRVQRLPSRHSRTIPRRRRVQTAPACGRGRSRPRATGRAEWRRARARARARRWGGAPAPAQTAGSRPTRKGTARGAGRQAPWASRRWCQSHRPRSPTAAAPAPAAPSAAPPRSTPSSPSPRWDRVGE